MELSISYLIFHNAPFLAPYLLSLLRFSLHHFTILILADPVLLHLMVLSDFIHFHEFLVLQEFVLGVLGLLIFFLFLNPIELVVLSLSLCTMISHNFDQIEKSSSARRHYSIDGLFLIVNEKVSVIITVNIFGFGLLGNDELLTKSKPKWFI